MNGIFLDSITVRWSLGRSNSDKTRKISGRWSQFGVWSHIRVHLLNKDITAGGLWSHIGVWLLIKGSIYQQYPPYPLTNAWGYKDILMLLPCRMMHNCI